MKHEFELADGSTHYFTFGGGKEEITQEYRDTLLEFNTVLYWWCYYDVTDNKLYDQFGVLLRTDGREYLTRIGLMDKEGNVISDFQNEPE